MRKKIKLFLPDWLRNALTLFAGIKKPAKLYHLSSAGRTIVIMNGYFNSMIKMSTFIEKQVYFSRHIMVPANYAGVLIIFLKSRKH